MIIANGPDGRRINARHKESSDAHCPECGDGLIAKVGEIVRPHFAHHPGSVCVLADRSESAWHHEWKWLLMNAGWDVEVPIGSHRADAVRMGQVVEIQSRPLDRGTVAERGDEYGRGLVWVVKAINSKRVEVDESRGEIVAFKNALIWLREIDRPIIIDCGARAHLVSSISARWYSNGDGIRTRYAAAQIVESFSRVVLGTSRNFPRLIERLAKRSAAFGPSLWDRAPSDLWLNKGRRLVQTSPLMKLRYTPNITLQEAA